MNNKFTKEFDQRIGRVLVPKSDTIPRTIDYIRPKFPEDFKLKLYKYCSIKPRAGCYSLTFRPKSLLRPTIFSTVYKGTLRFEEVGSEIIVSADLYKFNFHFPVEHYGIAKKYNRKWGNLSITQEDLIDSIKPELIENNLLKLPVTKRIPIYPRSKYYSFLKGTSAQLSSLGFEGYPCKFTINFDEFVYQHPTTGFNGTFPDIASRPVRMILEETGDANYFEGNLYEGNTNLGSITLDWISPFFRRAELKIQRLEGAIIPQPVTNATSTFTQDFSTIFATAGWQLGVTRDNNEVSLPASLVGVQNPNSCWNPNLDNMHDLMDSLPGYDPDILDSRWKAYLIAIPATLGCSRGWMFDNGGGDVNDIAREGAVTHSHDGYPSSDGVDYGSAQDELQKDNPRAFLRSAAHEVGHTFNQIHQSFEGGNDNSIMTVTPSVASVLDNIGEDFPGDINLSFNTTVRRHLIHLPDPAVRPGAMQFFGSSVTGPEADVNFFDSEDLELRFQVKSRIKLGEPVYIQWALTNRTKESIPVPDQIDVNSQIAHISVTSPLGSIRYMKPLMVSTCRRLHVSRLEPGKARKSDKNLFWSPNGFAFETPGKHQVDIILIWEIEGLTLGVRSSFEIWVDYPVNSKENEVAALMLTKEVGKFIEYRNKKRYKEGLKQISKVLEKHANHPACDILNKLLDKSNKDDKK